MLVPPSRSSGTLLALMLALSICVAAFTTSAIAAQAQDDGPAPAAAVERRAPTDTDDDADLTKVAPLPKVTAKAFVVHDGVTNQTLASLDPAESRPIASLTKVMTALVVTERTQPSDIVTVPAEAAAIGVDAASMGLRTGEKWKVEDLLQAMLVYSANDAAIALAAHVGDGSVDAFIELMNERADELDLSGTNYTSVTGLDAPGNLTTSTPLDLVALAQVALEEPRIRAAVRREELNLTRPGSQPGDADAKIELPTRNPLLGSHAGVDGIKTGFTDAAGYMLLLHYTDDVGNDLFVVTADSSSEATRAADGAALLDWATPLRQRLRIVEAGTDLGTVDVAHSSRKVRVFVCDDVNVEARVGQRVSQVVSLPRMVTPPIRTGDEIGEIAVDVDGTTVATVPVCSRDGARAEDWKVRTRRYVGDYRAAWHEGTDFVLGRDRDGDAAA